MDSAQPAAPFPLRPKQPVMEPKIVDITEKFTTACRALDIGQLVKDEYFTLFESIGAVEIMDPKMDSGFLQPGETLEDDYDPLKPILPQELIGIMDQLLCYEMAWHTGYPLSQTLFTSIHLDRLLWPEPKVLEKAQFFRGKVAEPPGLLHEVLRAYCLAVIKCCDYVIAKVTARDYFEEEDFSTHTYNRVLFVQVPTNVFDRELDCAIELIEDSLDIDQALRSAIITRLDFRKSFLAALDIDLPITHLRASWAPVTEHLGAIENTHSLGKLVPEAFSTKIQRRLASTVPPRPIVELDFEDAIKKLQQLCVDCKEATRLADIQPDPLEYISFQWAFASRKPAPLTYSRSYLGNILFDPNILQTSSPLLLDDISTFVIPRGSPILDPHNWAISPPLTATNANPPIHPRRQIAMILDNFVELVGPPYLNVWVALGQNTCRLRRMLTRDVSEWDILEREAKTADEELAYACAAMKLTNIMPNPLGTWIQTRKLWMIEKVILLGFDQAIYLPDEFAGMYHFLHAVSHKRSTLLQNCLHHITSSTSTNSSSPTSLSSAEQTPDPQQTTYLRTALAAAKATSSLSSALTKLYTSILRASLLPLPKRPLATLQSCYDVRMKPFLNSVPGLDISIDPVQLFDSFSSPAISGDDEKNNGDGMQTTPYNAIEKEISEAKTAWEEVRDAGAAACKAGGVADAWGREVGGMLEVVGALGEAVAKLREGGDIEVVIPEVGGEGWFVQGFVVPRVIARTGE